MVATTRQLLTTAGVDPVDRLAGGELVRFTVADVQAMLRQQILPEDASTELLDGIVLRKDRASTGEGITAHGTRHSLAVSLLARMGISIDSDTCHVRSQLPIVCDEVNAPEPDFAVVRGVPRDYAERLPMAADVLTLMEVADSSLERDSERKLGIYARAGISPYLIMNLRNDTIEQYTDPDGGLSTYRTKITFTGEQVLTLRLEDDRGLAVPVNDLLP